MPRPASHLFTSAFYKPRNPRAFTLVELLATIAIIAVLAGLAIVGVQKGLRMARISESKSNLRQIGQTINLYANDNKGVYPLVWDSDTSQSWIAIVWPYIYDSRRFPGTTPAVLEGSVFYTSLVEDGTTARTFGLNELLQKRLPARRFRNFSIPAQISLVGDTKNNGSFRVDQVNYRNDGRVNVLFLDGHVMGLAPSDVPTSTTSQFWAGGLTTSE